MLSWLLQEPPRTGWQWARRRRTIAAEADNKIEGNQMLCALTGRNLKPGTMEQFKQGVIPDDTTNVPAGWKRFYAVQNVNDENQVITFGLFDGTLDELRASQQEGGSEYEDRRTAAGEFVESVDTDGVFEVVEERSMG